MLREKCQVNLIAYISACGELPVTSLLYAELTVWRVDWQTVGLSVGHVRKFCKNRWTDRDAVWGSDSGGPLPRNHVLDGVKVTNPFAAARGQHGDAAFRQTFFDNLLLSVNTLTRKISMK